MSESPVTSRQKASWLPQNVAFIAMVVFALYGVAFALAPQWARSFPFEAAFYGSSVPEALLVPDVQQALNVYCAVIGGLLAGFGTLLALLVKFGVRRAWDVALIGIAVWFVVDSLGSVLSGIWQNALLNVGFAAFLAIVLLASRPRA